MTVQDAIAEESRSAKRFLERQLAALSASVADAVEQVRSDVPPSLNVVSVRLVAVAEAWEMLQAWRVAAGAAARGGGAAR